MTNKQTFATSLAVIAATFRQALEPETIDGYWDGLNDLTEAQFAQARTRALRECKFMPSPAELRALVGLDAKAALKSDIAIAWERVRWARRYHSYTTGVDFGPLVNAVIRTMGGWVTFCEWNDDVLESFERRKFAETYEAFAGKQELGDISRPLRGEFAGIETVPIAGRMLPEPRQELSHGYRGVGLLGTKGGEP